MEAVSKKDKIKGLVAEMIGYSQEAMLEKLERVMNSGCIDIEGWDEENGKMLLPKAIMTALLESEHYQYSGEGTTYARKQKKEVRNIRYFI